MLYPAFFHFEDGVYWVNFPDVPGCYSDGKTLEEAINNASEAISLHAASMLDHGQEIPKPSDIRTLDIDKDTIASLVPCNAVKYRQNKKAVKKTLSIPSWLNDKATAAGINFSQVLQEALMQKLNLV